MIVPEDSIASIMERRIISLKISITEQSVSDSAISTRKDWNSLIKNRESGYFEEREEKKQNNKKRTRNKNIKGRDQKVQEIDQDSCPGQRKSIMFCIFYRNLQKTFVRYDRSSQEEDQIIPAIVCFDLNLFEKELAAAMKITKHIVIGCDWDANSAWLDENIDEIGEYIVYFINNNLNILNSNPFNHTFDDKRLSLSSIDTTLCLHWLILITVKWQRQIMKKQNYWCHDYSEETKEHHKFVEYDIESVIEMKIETN
ncbi:hypothetical protein RFI_01974 [Reticulomyxa filosa]|uniref:Uncharacterized protein n=1 Tax=Reticulomyxa filosa TaxID=46433 RepID=X6P989_RETFI|nr:hypothetical protein RFI_01974 [Reticulomyxa filosa]|eukprot:ETO35100.1 hypothetical protein RFI_01974 [Reticulomyxa filosa]